MEEAALRNDTFYETLLHVLLYTYLGGHRFLSSDDYQSKFIDTEEQQHQSKFIDTEEQ
ncbi:MAG: hypothetical protein AAF757_16600 [Cyanobacteria bacterium P01_D01_bin.116]